jgi:hypothetical protein
MGPGEGSADAEQDIVNAPRFTDVGSAHESPEATGALS